MEEATAIPEQVSAIIEFSAQLLHMLGYDQHARHIQCWTDLPLFICSADAHVKPSVCVFQAPEISLLPVQAAKQYPQGKDPEP
jgi:hypothetical protein